MRDDQYAEAADFVERNLTSGGSYRMAKLLLSLWNTDVCLFNAGDALRGLDRHGKEIGLAMLNHYAENGETDELVAAGHRIHLVYPHLWELGQAAQKAMAALRDQWERERKLEEQ